MSVMCCEKEQTAPYCPLCGNQLRENSPLDWLEQHVATGLKSSRRCLKVAEESKKRNPKDWQDARRKRYFLGRQSAVAVREESLAELRRLRQQDQGKPAGPATTDEEVT